MTQAKTNRIMTSIAIVNVATEIAIVVVNTTIAEIAMATNEATTTDDSKTQECNKAESLKQGTDPQAIMSTYAI